MSLLISLKQNPVLHPQLLMNDTVISESTSHKHLGVTFSNTCSWTEHIAKITKSAWLRLNLLRALKFKINRIALEKIYIDFIRPHSNIVIVFGTIAPPNAKTNYINTQQSRSYSKRGD